MKHRSTRKRLRGRKNVRMDVKKKYVPIQALGLISLRIGVIGEIL